MLVIGAHPDDENTTLLTWLSRGAGAQAAYLSLTRGEGGQNLIGAELGPALGVIRTEELLAAREIDGARQYFTRAYDFGFSKSAEETFRFWPRDSLLQDVVEVMRRFRPQIVVSIFSGTPRDGHGQHQAAGLVARQAFELLRDSSWGPVKLYRSTGFDSAASTLTIPAGTLDPIIGQSYYQLAMSSRSRHRSQDMGQLQRPGPNDIRLALLASKAGAGGDPSLFSGVDTTVRAPGYAALIDSARATLNPWRPADALPRLLRARRALGAADVERYALLDRAIAGAAGVAIDATADDEIVAQGQRVQLEVTVWNAGDSTVRVEDVAVAAPEGWTVERLDAPAAPIAPGAVATRRFVATVAGDAGRSQPYFLRRPLVARGGLYDWTGVPNAVRGLPFEPPLLEARVRVTVAGTPVTLTREVVYRYRNQAIGEIRRPVFVTREFDVAISPDDVLLPLDGVGRAARRFTVTVTNRARGPAAGRVVFAMPRGWDPVPAETVAFAREDETKTVSVTLSAPGGLVPGAYDLRAAVVGPGGRRHDGALAIIEYPHIRPRAVVRGSIAAIRAARIALPGLTRVGYVRGASDRVPEALAGVGVPIELLGPDSLARGDLSRYDAVVIGSRAYETDPALVANNGRILDYARAGGLVIVQYQQYAFVDGGFAPYPLRIARPHDRVTDETAPITPLVPMHPLFHAPNQLGADDWRGWVQERGLYFAREWDSTYAPLVETHDPASSELKGGLLVAPLGRGTYVYTGLSFFRQLPGGVPGAYRLFANLLALRKANVP